VIASCALAEASPDFLSQSIELALSMDEPREKAWCCSMQWYRHISETMASVMCADAELLVLNSIR